MDANQFAQAIGVATNEALNDHCALAQMIFVLDSTSFELKTMHLALMRQQAAKQAPLIVQAGVVPRVNGN